MLLSAKNLKKMYKSGDYETAALNDVSLEINKGEVVVILGPSGSGKTTLLNVCSGLDTVSSGQLIFDGKDISKYNSKDLTLFRRDNIGVVFQGYNLLTNLTVAENIEVGGRLAQNPIEVKKIIETVELSNKQHKFPHQLSGGEQQRVSIARAVAKNPKVLFCDEPTGALDEKTGKKVLQMLQNVNRELNTTILIITHNPGIAEIANKVIKMNSGKIIDIKINNEVIDAENVRWA